MVAIHAGLFDVKATEQWKLTNEYAEPGEVDLIRWIDVNDVKKYNWTNSQITNIEYTYKQIFGFAL